MMPPVNSEGGIFQYALSVVDSLLKYSKGYNYTVICPDIKSIDWLSYFNEGRVDMLRIPNTKTSATGKISVFLGLKFNMDFVNFRKNRTFFQIDDKNIKFLVIPFPSLFGIVNDIPYIVSIPDLMHRYYPHFPEYSFRERMRRDFIYKNSSTRSILTIVDDEKGADDLRKFYRIQESKIRVIPYVPPGYIYKHKGMDINTVSSILKKYNLPERFLFYPAQFWYHKNHIRLVKALKYIKQHSGIEIPLVLSGVQKGNFKKVMDLIKELKMETQVIYLGYVSHTEIVALYKKSVALAYPSLFGPTNIPPLEAMTLGVPVVCSNLFSMPKQLGSAGLLFDPFNVKDIAEKIRLVWTDEKLRKELIVRGYEQIKDVNLENFAKKWEMVIDESLAKFN